MSNYKKKFDSYLDSLEKQLENIKETDINKDEVDTDKYNETVQSANEKKELEDTKETLQKEVDDLNKKINELNKKVNDRIDLGGKKFSAHTLRHSAATYMLDNKANLREIQEFLGHSYLTTTQTYTHLRNNQVYETQQKIFGDF